MVQININGSDMGAEINRKVLQRWFKIVQRWYRMVQRSNSEMVQKCSKYGSKIVQKWFTNVSKMF